MNRTDIINLLIDKYKLKKYLEIGVRDPDDNFNKINIEYKVGVDPQPIKPVKYQMTSDKYFKINSTENFDIVFIDGLHTSEQVYKDTINSLKILNDNGFIVLHDCNPKEEYHTRSYEDYLKTRGVWNGDVYKGFINLKYELKDYNCFVVDEDHGCGIITKNNLNKKFYPLKKEYKDIDWDFFDKNRNNLLDLISYNLFLKLFL